MAMIGQCRLSLALIFSVLFAFGCTGTQPRNDSTLAVATAKISPELMAVAKRLEAGTNPAQFEHGYFVRTDAQGRIQVYVHVAQVTDDEVKTLTANGLAQALPSPALHVIQGWIRPQGLAGLAELSFVTRITPPAYGYPQAKSGP